MSPHIYQPIRTRILPSEFNSTERLKKDLENIIFLTNFLDIEAGLVAENSLGASALETYLQSLFSSNPEYSNISNDSTDEPMEDENTPTSISPLQIKKVCINIFWNTFFKYVLITCI